MPPFTLSFLLLLSFALAEEADETAVISVLGEPQFDAALQSAPLVFVKFYHPRCPVCQRLRVPYAKTAASFALHNESLRFASVDISRRSNGALTELHSSGGVPTLLLFSRAVLTGEYNGARDPNSMRKWLQARLDARAAPLLTRINSRADRTAFLTLHGAAGGAVALAMAAPPARPALDALFATAASRMRDPVIGAPRVAFANVAHPSLLISDDVAARERYTAADVYAAAPHAAAARSARDFASAQWWYPGVLGGEPLSTFIARATLPRDGTAMLTESNVAALSASTTTILYAFGSRSSPDETTGDELRGLAEAGGDDIVVVYAQDTKFPDLAHHLGLPAVTDSSMPRPTRFVLYRAGNRGAERRVHDKSDGQVVSWMARFIEAHGKRPDVLGRAGIVSDITDKNWDTVFEHDGRIVVLLVTRASCSACERAALAMTNAAAMLKADARTVRLVSYEDTGKAMPQLAGVDIPKTRPYVAIVPPGEKPKQVIASASSSNIIAAAREAIKAKTTTAVELHVYGTRDSGGLAVTLTHIGVLLMIVGVALSVQKHTLGKRIPSAGRRKGAPSLWTGTSLLDRLRPRKFWVRR